MLPHLRCCGVLSCALLCSLRLISRCARAHLAPGIPSAQRYQWWRDCGPHVAAPVEVFTDYTLEYGNGMSPALTQQALSFSPRLLCYRFFTFLSSARLYRRASFLTPLSVRLLPLSIVCTVCEYVSGYPLPLLVRNLTEAQLWSVAVQMLVLLNAIHRKRLFLRNFNPVTLLVRNGRLVTRAGAIDDFLLNGDRRETEEESTVFVCLFCAASQRVFPFRARMRSGTPDYL